MKRHFPYLIYIYILFGATLMLAVGGCKEEEDTWDHPKKRLDRTLIFYMAAENSLSYFVNEDSSEIANSMTLLPEGCRAVMYIDDTKSSRLCVGTREHPMQTVKVYNRNVCSTDSTEMEAVLSEIIKRYPAKSYGLVLWSHASGWVFNHEQESSAPRRTFGIDNGNRSVSNSGRQMNITTLARILSHYPHFDFIFCDACFMQTIEVAYELREVTDWFLGSPAEIPGSGAPYEYVMAAMGPSEVQPDLILEPYYDYYTYGIGFRNYRGAILSAIKTSELPQLAEATRPLVQRLFANRNLLDCSWVQRYCPLVESEYFTEFYDMADIIRNHVSDEEFRQWWAALMRAVPYRFISTEWTTSYSSRPMHIYETDYIGAVSMFVPTQFYDDLGWMEKYHKLQWYEAVGMDKTGW